MPEADITKSIRSGGISPACTLCFRLHDAASGFLVRHLSAVKLALLMAAHLALFGIFFPELRKDFGNLAAMALIAILFLSPLSRIFRMRLLGQLMGLRREFGIIMGYLATVHVAGYLIDPLWVGTFLSPYAGAKLFSMEPTFLFGIAAYLLTLPLLLTSNTVALRLLGGRRWKGVHRLAYPLLIFTMLHRFTVKGMTALALSQAAILIGAYAALRLLARKDAWPPLRRAIASVGARYEAWNRDNQPDTK